MAKKSVIMREQNRARLVEKFQQRRCALKEKIKKAINLDEMIVHQKSLSKLPLNSSASRHTYRCQQCGRARAVYRKFGLCRICLRQHLMMGNITGGRKASW